MSLQLSGNKIAATGLVSDVTQGATLSLLPSGTIEVNQTAGVTSTTLKSFDFGCVVNTVLTSVPVAESCTIYIKTTLTSGKPGPQETYTFTAGGPLRHVDLPSTFTGLKSIEIGVEKALPLLTAVQLDNPVHCNVG